MGTIVVLSMNDEINDELDEQRAIFHVIMKS